MALSRFPGLCTAWVAWGQTYQDVRKILLEGPKKKKETQAPRRRQHGYELRQMLMAASWIALCQEENGLPEAGPAMQNGE